MGLCLQETMGSPEEEQKPQSTISALRRSFLEGGGAGGGGGQGVTEWEKRLASSPLRRVDDSPMIEPLEPDEVRGHTQIHTCRLTHRKLPVCLSGPPTGQQFHIGRSTQLSN